MNKFGRLLVIVGMVLGWGAAAVARDLPTYACHELKTTPILDGNIGGDAAWEGVEQAGGFTAIGDAVADELQRTDFCVGVTEDAMYVGVICCEPEIGKLSLKAEDGSVTICGDDSIELFILHEGIDEYFHFMASARGARWNGRGLGSSMPLGPWKAAVYREARYYSIEIEIPFELLKAVPDKDEVWRVGLNRNIVAGQRRMAMCWGPNETGYHEPRNFGRVVFMDSVAGPEACRARQAELLDRVDASLGELRRLHGIMLGALPNLDPGLQAEVGAMSGRLKAIELEIRKSAESDIGELIQVLQSVEGCRRQADALAADVLTASMMTRA